MNNGYPQRLIEVTQIVYLGMKIATGKEHLILLPTLCTYLIKNYHNSHLKPTR